MILSFLLLICGYIRYSVTTDNYENVIVSLFDHGLVPIRQKKKKNIAYFDFYRKNSNEVCKAVSSVCEYTKKERGINTFLRKFKRRYGLVLGLVIIAASVFVSKMFIWNINIEGLNTVRKTVYT